MSSNTSTPAALSSDAHPLAGTCWRLVEAQHLISTLKLVDSVDEQLVLEDLIESSKPPCHPNAAACIICSPLHSAMAPCIRVGRVSGAPE
jgi:hypothetical protein